MLLTAAVLFQPFGKQFLHWHHPSGGFLPPITGVVVSELPPDLPFRSIDNAALSSNAASNLLEGTIPSNTTLALKLAYMWADRPIAVQNCAFHTEYLVIQ